MFWRIEALELIENTQCSFDCDLHFSVDAAVPDVDIAVFNESGCDLIDILSILLIVVEDITVWQYS